MRKDIVASVVAVVVFTVLAGLVYPLVVTGIAQVAFPNRADGSTITRDNQIVGSKLIGQDWRRDTGKKDKDGNRIMEPIPKYFQSRPSADSYAPDATFFNNLGPNQKDLADQIRAAGDSYLSLESPYDKGLQRKDIPPDAVTTSASGIDPHISKDNAEIQAFRVAQVRGIPRDDVLKLIDRNTDGRFLFLGEPGVNVHELNLALDREQT
jgi:K+-transporting ATPase ATPase C chain